MKMKKEHHEALKKALTVISPELKWRYKKLELSKQRYLWDCYWFVCDNNLFRPKTLYTYLNDSHIETALRQILPFPD